jgi:hypothetical protein
MESNWFTVLAAVGLLVVAIIAGAARRLRHRAAPSNKVLAMTPRRRNRTADAVR